MGRTPCCEKAVGLKKGPWTPEEDHKLLAFIDAHGHGSSWSALPSKAGLQRCGKSCRLRWTNYLRPDIKRGKFSVQEEQTIIQLHALLGNRWSAIASQLPRRTDNEIKNYWNTHIKKRLTKMGIDPITHMRRTTAALGSSQTKNVAHLSHMAQWENARLQAEARHVREAKLVVNPNQLQHQHNSSAQLVCRPTTLQPLIMRPRSHCRDVLKAWQGIMLGNYTLESPTSTLNFSEIPSVGFLRNQAMAMANNLTASNTNRGMMIMKQNELAEILEPISEKMEPKMQAYNNDMLQPINFVMEAGLTELVDRADGRHNLTENYSGGDLEEMNWNNILNNLANLSPLGSPVAVFDLITPVP